MFYNAFLVTVIVNRLVKICIYYAIPGYRKFENIFLFKAVWMDGQRCQVCVDYSRGVPYVDGSKQGLGRTLWSCILFKDLYNKKQ